MKKDILKVLLCLLLATEVLAGGKTCLNVYKRKEINKGLKIAAVLGVSTAVIIGGVVAAPITAAAAAAQLAALGVTSAAITSGISTGVLVTGSSVGGIGVLSQFGDIFKAFGYGKMRRLIKYSQNYQEGKYSGENAKKLPKLLEKFSVKKCKLSVEEVAPAIAKGGEKLFCLDKKNPWTYKMTQVYITDVVFGDFGI